MARYRKNPVVIEAEQYSSTGDEPFGYLPEPPIRFNQRAEPYIETLEGPLKVSEGDWIIRGVKGEFYPCKPEIFEATYEAV